jgi:hypothetical protein
MVQMDCPGRFPAAPFWSGLREVPLSLLPEVLLFPVVLFGFWVEGEGSGEEGMAGGEGGLGGAGGTLGPAAL